MRFALLFFILFLNINAFCCLNAYDQFLATTKYEIDYKIKQIYFNSEELESDIEIFYKDYSINDKEFTDVVAIHCYLGNYENALSISNGIVKKFPNEYNVVINHAVALELNNKLEEALIYLKRAVRINPASHNNSEWIHIKILEHILANKPNNQSIFGFDFGNEIKPNYSKINLYSKVFLFELEFQLQDRLYFASKNDTLFGHMLFDYAHCLWIAQIDKEYVLEALKLAKQYNCTHPMLDMRIFYLKKIMVHDKFIIEQTKINEKISKINDLINKDNRKLNEHITIIGLLMVPVVLIWFLVSLFKK